ncbi:unnamed protein product, partial [Mesorhabditis spiculigera]
MAECQLGKDIKKGFILINNVLASVARPDQHVYDAGLFYWQSEHFVVYGYIPVIDDDLMVWNLTAHPDETIFFGHRVRANGVPGLDQTWPALYSEERLDAEETYPWNGDPHYHPKPRT